MNPVAPPQDTETADADIAGLPVTGIMEVDGVEVFEIVDLAVGLEE